MTLSKEDAELFYDLWFPLLNFVNKKLKIIPGIGEIHRTKNLNLTSIKKIANALWDNIFLIDEYLAKHSNKLSEENRGIVMSWKRCVADDFILERHLKSGSVFISLHTENVYLVKGLFSSWEDMLFDCRPPIALEAALIPFKNVIISDGIVTPYNVIFGKNYASSFKEIYMSAKKSGTIIKTL